MGSASVWITFAWFGLPLAAIGFWAIVLGLGAAGSKGGGATILIWIASYLILSTNNQLPDNTLWVVVPSVLAFLPIIALCLATGRAERLTAEASVDAVRPTVRRPARKGQRRPRPEAEAGSHADDIPAGQKLLAAGMSIPLVIDYLDQAGEETRRQIVVHKAIGIPRPGRTGRVMRVQAFCTLRKQQRTFLRSGILTVANPQTGEVIGELDRFLLEGR